MDINLAKELSKNCSRWLVKKRIDFAEHGEPTLHPELFLILAQFREDNPSLQLGLTTNGTMLRKYGLPFLLDIFKAGLNVLLIDTYTHRIEIEELTAKASQSGIQVGDYYDPFYKIDPYFFNNKGHSLKSIVLMGGLETYNKKRVTRVIHNNAGNSDPEKLKELGIMVEPLPLYKKCSRPFREIVVLNDGTVPTCCFDFRHEAIMGQFPNNSLEEIWDSKVFNIFRSVIHSKNRMFTPCFKCNFNGGFRLGLIKWDSEASQADIELLKEHKLAMAKHQHPSVPNGPLWIEPNKIGIRKYLK
jgi:radical SAM protein with 4Fe4S-binding SPASM domain